MTPLPPPNTDAALCASFAVTKQMHNYVCDLGSLADAAEGLAELLEQEADDRGDGKKLSLRGLVRLATAVSEDAATIHRGLDDLWLKTGTAEVIPPPISATQGRPQSEAIDDLSLALAQIKSGLGMLREAAHCIDGNRALEDRMIFLIDALEGHAAAGDAAFDRATGLMSAAEPPT